ncbi:hypothetical protein ACUN15_22125, partial [Bacillus cereus group sp. BceL175]
PGYKKLEKPVPFEITKGMTKSLAFTVENEMVDTGNVEVTKVDKNTNLTVVPREKEKSLRKR